MRPAPARRACPASPVTSAPTPAPRLGRCGDPDLAGQLRCGFRGCGSAGAPRGCRAWARRGGAGADPVLARRRGGAGRALAPEELPGNFSLSSPGRGRKARGPASEESGLWSSSADRQQLPSPGRLRMRPGWTGGAPLLVLLLSQGKRGVSFSISCWRDLRGAWVQEGGVCGMRGASSAPLCWIPRGPRLPAIRSWIGKDSPFPLSPAWCPHKA